MSLWTRGSTHLRQAEVLVHGRRVEYQAAGSGEPVVLVHGLAGSMRWWRRNVPALAEGHRVYLVNLPGFGSFRRRGHRFVLAEAADWFGDWMQAVGIAPCHVVAHSMGGHVAIRLAARRPHLVRRLVLVAPAIIAGGRPLRAYPGALVAAVRAASPSFLPVLALDTLRAGPRTILRAARSLLAEDVREDLGAVSMPTLLVWGERDALVPPSVGLLVRAQLPDARLLLLPGAGHVPQYDRAEPFNAATLAFLAGQVTAPSAPPGLLAPGSWLLRQGDRRSGRAR